MADLQRTLPVAAAGGLAIAGAARVRGTDTHGRWPWLAAVAAPPAAVATFANRRRRHGLADGAIWAAVPLLLAHQTEEWVLPGGFLDWFNHDMWGSADAEFPLTRPIGMRINVIVGWGFSALACAGARRAPWIGAAVLTTHIGNGLLHSGRAVVDRRYNPGLATGTLLGPLGLAGTTALLRGGGRAERFGMALGALVSVATVAGFRRRVRGSVRP